MTRAAAPTTTAAPARASQDFAGVEPPAIIRLDTVRQGYNFVVRAAGSDSAIGWWNVTSADSLRVVNSAGNQLALRAGDRVRCPRP